MGRMHSESVDIWDPKKAVQRANRMAVDICGDDANGLLGFDMMAKDGNVFAHGHMTLEVAEQFVASAAAAVAELKRRRHRQAN